MYEDNRNLQQFIKNVASLLLKEVPILLNNFL